MKIASALAALLILSSCAATGHSPGDAPPSPEGPVALDQPLQLGQVVVTPKEVTEDSRCPMNARCIWAGRVILSAKVQGSDWQETAALTLGEPYSTHGTTVTLSSVQPEKMTGQEIEPADYRFDFEGGD